MHLQEFFEKNPRLIWEITREAIALVDKDGIIVEANNALCDFLGYPQSELMGKHFVEITDSKDVPADREAFKELSERGPSIINSDYDMQKSYVTRNREVVQGSLKVTKLQDGDFIVFVGQVMPFHEFSIDSLTQEQKMRIIDSEIGTLFRAFWNEHSKKIIAIIIALALGAETVRELIQSFLE